MTDRSLNPSRRLLSVLLLLFTLVGAVTVLAQDAADTPLTVGVPALVTLDASNPTSSLVFDAAEPQSVTVQVTAAQSGIRPLLHVRHPSGIRLFADANVDGSDMLTSDIFLPSAGRYQFELSSQTGSSGEVALLLLTRAPAPQPVPLALGEARQGVVALQHGVSVYRFDGLADESLVLDVEGGPSVPFTALFDGASNELVAFSAATVDGVRYRIPVESAAYRLSLSYGGGDAEPYTVCLHRASMAGCSGAEATPVPTASAPAVAACLVSVAEAPGINIRSGPGTNTTILGVLNPGATATALSLNEDNTWIQIDLGGLVGWVYGPLVLTQGGCGVLYAPAGPTPTATTDPVDVAPPTPTATTDPGNPPTAGHSPTPTPTAAVPTATPGDNGILIVTPGVLSTLGPNSGLSNVDLPALQSLAPDLFIEVYAVPSTWEQLRPLSVSIRVRNSGLTAAGPFNVGMVIGDSAGHSTVPGLAAGASVLTSVTVTPPDLGTLPVLMRVDSGGDVAETDEGNNLRATSIEITPLVLEVIDPTPIEAQVIDPTPIELQVIDPTPIEAIVFTPTPSTGSRLGQINPVLLPTATPGRRLGLTGN